MASEPNFSNPLSLDSREPVTVLMVDDQPSKLISYEAILGDLNERLIKASSGREALDHLLKSDVAVVLMDVSMPEIDGFELAHMMRQHPRFQKTPIIFVSAVHLTDIDKLRAYQSGAVDYISVPVIPEVLRAKVSVFTDLHRKTRELQLLNQELERRVAERSDELRRLNQQLQKQVATLKERAELLDLATEAIMVRDLSGTIRFWNAGAESLYGWTREEAVGSNAHRLLATKPSDSVMELSKMLPTRGHWEGKLRHQTRDGRHIVVASRQAVQHDSAAILEINRDITGEVLAEEALRRNDRLAAMGKLAGIVAHEINNPLAAITNTFYLLSKHPSLDEQARHYAELADRELSRISHITKQTLSFYRESQKAEPVLLSELLDSILEIQDRSFRLANITLEKRYRSKGQVFGFPSELKQVFMNLVTNSIQAMTNGGKLRLTIRDVSVPHSHAAYVAVHITDNGTGILAEHAKHLFEPFFTTKAVKGTGLGLWISQGIISKHDGSIGFRSLPGKDKSRTTFRVVLPAHALKF